MSNNIEQVLLVGTGGMAREYIKVLDAVHVPYKIVGNTIESVKRFNEDTGKSAVAGGVEKYINLQQQVPRYAIVAVNGENLFWVTKTLIVTGVTRILVEKPGAVTTEQLIELRKKAKEYNAKVFVAYNRRFYCSVRKLKEIVEKDGGIESINFEFTEWQHVIEKTDHPDEIKQKWFLMNSSHVVDLVFYLAGNPKEIHSYKRGYLTWHKAGSIYAGCGITEKNVIFNYQANWEAPGRWGIEVLTCKHRLYLRPLEKLQVQNIASVKIEDYPLDDKIDMQYKSGLFCEVKALLNDTNLDVDLCSIDEQIEHMNIYSKISGEVY